MPQTTATEVHIETLYRKIDDLQKNCSTQHEAGLEATLRLHGRIDEFVKFMTQLSEINKDVQAAIAHQKSIESEMKSIVSRVSVVERVADSGAETVEGIKKISWAIALGFGGLFGAALWQIVVNYPK